MLYNNAIFLLNAGQRCLTLNDVLTLTEHNIDTHSTTIMLIVFKTWMMLSIMDAFPISLFTQTF